MISLVLVFSFVFAYLGEVRLAARGVDPGEINNYLGSRVDSVIISWFYGYVAMGYDVLSLYYNEPPSFDYFWLFKQISSGNYFLAFPEKTISSFNAATFLKGHIVTYGRFYIVSLAIYAFFLGLIVVALKSLRFKACYLFVCALLFLMPFGDYFLNRSIFLAILFTVAVFPFVGREKDLRYA